MTGWLASIFGRKRLVQGAVIGFPLFHAVRVRAESRVFNRVPDHSRRYRRTMQPLSQAIMLEAFPPKDRGKAMGFWGLGIVVAPSSARCWVDG